MPYAHVNRQRIHFEDTGAGLPLVLTHGFLMDQEMFAGQSAGLAGEYRVVTWDARGHGLTESTPDAFSYWDCAEDLRGLLDHLGIERAVVGGMSQGGFISLRFALRHPERVAGLVLIDTQAGTELAEKVPQYDMMADVWTAEGPNPVITGMVSAIIIGSSPEAEGPGAAYVAKWNTRHRDGIAQIFRTLMDRDDITDRLGEIAAPSLVIHGSDDIAIGLDRAEALARGLPNGTGPVLIEGAGHASNLTHPEPVNRAIRAFLATLPG